MSATRDAFVRPLPRAFAAREIAAMLAGAALVGDARAMADGIGALSTATPGTLAFCDGDAPSEALAATKASVIVTASLSALHPRDGAAVITTADPRGAFIELVERLLPGSARPAQPSGISPRARIDPSASVAASAAIGEAVAIGARTVVAGGAIIYDDTTIGDDCTIGPSASIGWVGLAYHDRADGRRVFFPHLAGVRIGDRVDIGAQASVCRGMLSHTVIGDDTRIGSLVYVSHGVTVGARAWLSAGTLVAGHATVAADALLGIGSVVVDNVVVGERVMVAGGSIVVRDAAAGARLLGVPATAVASMRKFGPTPRR
jgi:UDP-3-O-[3-hydroxymyristoyl] glucosamine N-acyltransferase